jgi:hypothetical protein
LNWNAKGLRLNQFKSDGKSRIFNKIYLFGIT